MELQGTGHEAERGNARDDGAGAPMSREISREMVALIKEYMGRGPSRTRTYLRDDLVACLMEDTMTKAERALHANGNHGEVRDIRRMLQRAYRDDAVAIVERLTGRRVISSMSDHDLDADLGIELFMLGPAVGEGSGAGVH